MEKKEHSKVKTFGLIQKRIIERNHIDILPVYIAHKNPKR